MIIGFDEDALADYQRWAETDKRVWKRINSLLRDIQRDPFDGIGKPEMLRANLSGHWSRRITDEHRLVYRVEGDTVIVIACRFHYV
jgi:toxin YoeB